MNILKKRSAILLSIFLGGRLYSPPLSTLVYSDFDSDYDVLSLGELENVAGASEEHEKQRIAEEVDKRTVGLDILDKKIAKMITTREGLDALLNSGRVKIENGRFVNTAPEDAGKYNRFMTELDYLSQGVLSGTTSKVKPILDGSHVVADALRGRKRRIDMEFLKDFQSKLKQAREDLADTKKIAFEMNPANKTELQLKEEAKINKINEKSRERQEEQERLEQEALKRARVQRDKDVQESLDRDNKFLRSHGIITNNFPRDQIEGQAAKIRSAQYADSERARNLDYQANDAAKQQPYLRALEDSRVRRVRAENEQYLVETRERVQKERQKDEQKKAAEARMKGFLGDNMNKAPLQNRILRSGSSRRMSK